MKKAAAVLVILSLTSAVFAAGPTIACEMAVQKTDLKDGDTWRASKDGRIWKLFSEKDCLKDKNAAREVYYLKKMFNEVGDMAPKASKTKYSGAVNVGKEIKQQTFDVNHSEYDVTTLYMGFGPEDDTQYNYENPYYFPKGSIKINLTERAYALIRFYYDYVVPKYGKNSPEAKGIVAFFVMLFSHESLHGYQLKTSPVLDFKRAAARGLLTPLLDNRDVESDLFNKIADGSRKIVNYEEDAINQDSTVTSGLYNVFHAAVEASAKWKEDPELQAEYPLLFGPGSNFYEYYMVDEDNDAKLTAEKTAKGEQISGFTPLTKYTYAVEYQPLQAFKRMVEINNALKNGGKCADYTTEVTNLFDQTMDLMSPWYGRTVRSANDVEIVKTIKAVEASESGLPEIKAAVAKEFDAFDGLCR